MKTPSEFVNIRFIRIQIAGRLIQIWIRAYICATKLTTFLILIPDGVATLSRLCIPNNFPLSLKIDLSELSYWGSTLLNVFLNVQIFVLSQVHEAEVIGMSISSNGKFIMTCSSGNDLVLWDLKGQIIARV